MQSHNNQTIDGVPRKLLENCANYTEGSASYEVLLWHKELRALLDSDECCHEFVPFQANCTKCGIQYKPAPQPQGEPAAVECTEEMYKAFVKVMHDNNNGSESYKDVVKNAIKAAIKAS